MADTVRSLAALQALLSDNSSGDISAQDVRDFLVSAYQVPGVVPGGRLTTESGVPVSTSDRTSQGTIYYTPYLHNRVGLYDGTSWTLFTFTERSLALSGLTSGKNYDVFLYDNAGTLTLELSAAWTNDTTRADALTTVDGVYVKSGATTRRYLGTIRTTGTTTTEDSATKRFVWNQYNRVSRPLQRFDTASASWTYASATFRQANANSANKVEVVVGQADATADLFCSSTQGSATTGVGHVALGEDSTTAATAQASIYPTFLSGTAGVIAGMFARVRKRVPLGYHYYAWLEACSSAVTVTFYAGDYTTGNAVQSGIVGSVDA